MRSMARFVRWIGVPHKIVAHPGQTRSIAKIPSEKVIGIAIAVIIYPNDTADLPIIHPQLSADIRMVVIQTGIDNRDDHRI